MGRRSRAGFAAPSAFADRGGYSATVPLLLVVWPSSAKSSAS